jgi:hypothetical protein
MKYAILGYDTINIGDDIQSFVTSTLLDIDYIILRDNYFVIYNFKTGEKINLHEINEKIYLIMNGWFMLCEDHWPIGKDEGQIKFPIINDNIIPIFISTCLSKDVKFLENKECIEYYKKYEPIFPRDLSTVIMLENNNVKCEFFGCLTQLLDLKNVIDNDLYKNKYFNSIIFVDCNNKELLNNEEIQNYNIYYFNHYINDLIKLNPIERINYAKDLLSKYKHAKKIYTTRLHCYLPCKAMGIDVVYVGEECYRTIDLIQNNCDKSNLLNKFYNIIKDKTNKF